MENIGIDFIFYEIPKKYVKFGFDTFYKAKCKFLVGVTDCHTGKLIYISKM